MTSNVKKNSKCQGGACSVKQNQSTNGKGDKTRPFVKKKYDKNYESINWKRK